MRKSFDRQLAQFLRKQRGELSYVEFAKKTGISHTMLHKLEWGERRMTLSLLERMLNRLRLKLSDVFPNEF